MAICPKTYLAKGSCCQEGNNRGQSKLPVQTRDNEVGDEDGGSKSEVNVLKTAKIDNYIIATLDMGNKRRLLPQRETAST